MKKTVPLVLLSLLVIGITGCDSSSDSATSSNSSSNSGTTSGASTSGTFTDSRDGQVYKYVKIGTQTWMAQNLNYQVDSSWCYANDSAHCAKYGRLYQWASAMGLSDTYLSSYWAGDTVDHQGACPSGWHVPTVSEIDTLLAYVGADSSARLLRSTTGWDSANGIDRYGFDATTTGIRYDNTGDFGEVGDLWTATGVSGSTWERTAWGVWINNNTQKASPSTIYKDYGIAVRCLKN